MKNSLRLNTEIFNEVPIFSELGKDIKIIILISYDDKVHYSTNMRTSFLFKNGSVHGGSYPAEKDVPTVRNPFS